MKDLMVDTETLATKTGAVITQIGACYFDRYTGEIGEKFEVNIRIQDSLDHGFIIQGQTLKFWFDQKNRSFLESPIDVAKAFGQFSEFCKKNTIGWAHATFDFTQLIYAYDLMNMKLPFHYRNMRDIRTLVDLSKVEYRHSDREDQEGLHDALKDAEYQVGYCSLAFNKLRLAKEENK